MINPTGSSGGSLANSFTEGNMHITETGIAAVNQSITRHRPVKREGHDGMVCLACPDKPWTLAHFSERIAEAVDADPDAPEDRWSICGPEPSLQRAVDGEDLSKVPAGELLQGGPWTVLQVDHDTAQRWYRAGTLAE